MPTYSFVFAFLLITVIGEDFQTRKKLFEFHFPVENDTGWDDDEVLTPDVLVACEMTEEGDGLDRLTVPISFLMPIRMPTHPRPISSARIPFILFAYRLASHSNPAC